MSLRSRVVRLLRETAERIDSGNSELSESEAMDIMRVLCREGLSKAQACDYLNLRRAQFDNLVRDGKLPRGKKIMGHKELRWYKDELETCSEQIRNNVK